MVIALRLQAVCLAVVVLHAAVELRKVNRLGDAADDTRALHVFGGHDAKDVTLPGIVQSMGLKDT